MAVKTDAEEEEGRKLRSRYTSFIRSLAPVLNQHMLCRHYLNLISSASTRQKQCSRLIVDLYLEEDGCLSLSVVSCADKIRISI